MAGLLFRMFRVDKIEVRVILQGEQLQLEMGEFRTELLFIEGGQANTFDDDVDEVPVQDLAINKDNVFQADQCDAFDSDVDEALTAQTMFMANLSSADPIYDEAGPSYDSDILFEAAQCISANEQNKEVNVSLTAELARYNKLVEVYEKGQVKTNHAPAVVHDSEDTIKLAEITRKRMLEKVKSPLCVEKKIKIAPPDYSKANYLATFTDPRTDILVLRDVDTKTNFSNDGNILRESKRLFVKEVKEMKKICEQMETEVEQNVMDKKSAEIKMKNLLIEFKNLTADCLSNEFLYSVMNAVNTVSRFSEMHDAYTVEQARCLELEAEISKLKHKIQKDDHNEMIKHFFKREVDHLNLQLKYQNLKDHLGKNKSQTSQGAPEFDSFFKINQLKEQLQGKDNSIRKLKEKISHMNERCSEADRTLDFKALDYQNIELRENVTALQEQNEGFRAENEKVKQHYKELYDSIKITRSKTIEKTSSLLTESEKLKAQLKGKIKCVTIDTIKPKVLALGMYAIDVEPIPPHNRNNREVHLDYLKHLKESVEILREIIEEARIKQPLDNVLEYACLYTKRS
ncbi:hypothetical protein Tco_1127623 [Tanacetum coccineum]